MIKRLHLIIHSFPLSLVYHSMCLLCIMNVYHTIFLLPLESPKYWSVKILKLNKWNSTKTFSLHFAWKRKLLQISEGVLDIIQSLITCVIIMLWGLFLTETSVSGWNYNSNSTTKKHFFYKCHQISSRVFLKVSQVLKTNNSNVNIVLYIASLKKIIQLWSIWINKSVHILS